MTFALFFSVVVTVGLLFANSIEQSKVNQCLQKYATKLSALNYLDKAYIEELQNLNIQKEPLNTSTTIVLDVGLGSIYHSEVFRHMVSLNISGLDHNHKSSHQCQHESNPRTNVNSFRGGLLDNNPRYIYVLGSAPNLPSHFASWLEVLVAAPNVAVLMNDVSDEEYYNKQNTVMCIPEWQRHVPKHCFVPLIPVSLGFNATIERHMLRNFTFDQMKAMLAAFRSLITCMVPAERLFQFNLNQMPTVEYWSKLTSFLNISLPGTASSSAKYLSEGGTVCDSVSQHTDARHLKRVQCADEYSTYLAAIYGPQFKTYVRDLLLRPIYIKRRVAPEDTDRIVLGIGPGSTGTRSIFFSTNQFDLTAKHYVTIHARSPLKDVLKPSDFEYDMLVLEKESEDRRVLWLDTPVPNRWWYIFRTYPNTQFIVTDVRNDTLWYEKRMAYHCVRNKLRVNEPSCIAPMAIRCDRNPLAYDLFRAAQIKIANITTISRSFDAYRALMKCVIPSDRRWWVYLSEETNCEAFWDRLLRVTKAEVSPQLRREFIAKGVPRCGSGGCMWNGTKHKVNY